MTTSSEHGGQDLERIAATVVEIGRDELLVALASIVGKKPGDAAMSITVNARGLVISGMLVHRETWLDAVEEGVNAGAGNDGQSLISGVRMAWARQDAKLDDGEVDRNFVYLHLKDARMLSGGQLQGEGLHWRVRISEVSSWSLGTMG